MDLQNRIQKIFREDITIEGKLPAGVNIPDRDEFDDTPKQSIIKSPVSKEVRKLNDIEPLIKNTDTNMGRLQQGVIDVKRALKDIDSKSGTNNLEKFNADYDKLKSEVEDVKKERMDNPTSSELFSKVKTLSNKIAITFGNNFYKIKKAIPGQLNGNVWTFSDAPTKPIEAPKPIVAPTPIVAPKIKNWEDELAASGYGKEDDPDAELGLSTKPRHAGYDDDEGPLRETIRNLFKL